MQKNMKVFLSVVAVITLAVIGLLATSTWWVWSERVAPALSKHDGIWSGHFDINGRGKFQFNALYVGDDLIAFSPDAKVSYRGNVRIEGDRYHSEMEMYLLTNGAFFDKVTLDGRLIAPDKIEANFLTQNAKDQGQLSLTRDKGAYKKKNLMEKINDEWIFYHGFTISKFSINKQGLLSGADTNGCGYEGEVSLIKRRFNAYRVKLLINSCAEMDGVYEGMGYLLSSVAEDDTFNIQVYKDGWSIYLPIVRDTSPPQPEPPT